jgi:hypothetical protein
MKKTQLIISTLLMLTVSAAQAQLMTFGFVKNCMAYGRTTVTDELTKKQYFVAERQKQNASNALLEGAMYYSNSHDASKGEIAVLSQITDKKNITEITFVKGVSGDYSANYTDVFNQMLKFFKNEKHFKSTRYKTDVTWFEADKIYYYSYSSANNFVIVVANYKLEDNYFKE